MTGGWKPEPVEPDDVWAQAPGEPTGTFMNVTAAEELARAEAEPDIRGTLPDGTPFVADFKVYGTDTTGSGDPNFDLIGWELDTDKGRGRVTGSTSWSSEYVAVELADGSTTCRPAAQVRARAGAYAKLAHELPAEPPFATFPEF